MTFRFLTVRGGAVPSAQTGSRSDRTRAGRFREYERPLARTGVSALWKVLKSGDKVQVILDGNHIRTGTVDISTRDGGTVWIFLDHGMGRIAVSDGDGVALVLLE